jgi:hypothetical protein
MSFALKTCPTSGCPGSERTFVSPVHDRKELKFCEYCGTPLILDPHYPEPTYEHQDSSSCQVPERDSTSLS